MACGTIRTNGNLAEYIRLLAFPFSLQDSAREWLYTLPMGSITTWLKMQQRFLEKYFPAVYIQSMRKKITSVKMSTGESFMIIGGNLSKS